MTRTRYLILTLLLALLPACTTTGTSARDRDAAEHARALAAQDDFDRAMQRAPTARTLYALARILEAQRRDAEAESVLNKLIASHRDFLPAYNDLAELYVRQRKIDQALQTLNAGLAVQPRSPVLLNNLGMAYLVKGDHEAALRQFTQAASLDADDARYRANMAVALGLMGRYDEAMSLYRQVTTPAEAHYNLAVLAESRRDLDTAQREYAAAEKETQLARKALNPNSTGTDPAPNSQAKED